MSLLQNRQKTWIAVVIATIAMVAAGCGTDNGRPAQSSNSESPTPVTPDNQFASNSPLNWPPSSVNIDRHTAIEIAYEHCEGDAEPGTVQPPVSRLMTLGEYETSIGGRSNQDQSKPVWVVQFEGEFTGHAGPGSTAVGEPETYRYIGCVLDAETGDTRGGFSSPSEPQLMPHVVLDQVPDEMPDPEKGRAAPASGIVTFTREDVRNLLREEYGGDGLFLERAELELVRYSSPYALDIVPPTPTAAATTPPVVAPTPTAGGPTPTTGPTSTPRPPRPSPTASPIDRLAWLVVIPADMGHSRCFISGPPREYRLLCLQPADWLVIDAANGEIHARSSVAFLGPQVSNEERQALTRFAWTEGWWELWSRIKEFQQERLPSGLATELDRPNAPTPTPWPPTPTPSGPRTATPTPTPWNSVRNPTPAPTSTPAPVPTATAAPTSTPTWQDFYLELGDEYPEASAINVSTHTTLQFVLHEPLPVTRISVSPSVELERIDYPAPERAHPDGGQGVFYLYRPTSPLSPNTTYEVTVEVGYVDSSGQEDIATHTWSFTTSGPPQHDYTDTVALPQQPYHPAGFGALSSGELVAEGSCLYLDNTPDGRYLLIFEEGTVWWEGDTLFLRGNRYRMGDSVALGGGFVDYNGQGTVQAPDPACITEEVFVNNS